MTTSEVHHITLPAFENEALLRQAVAKLLALMPGTFNIAVLHGPQEIGKDIVFSTLDVLGETIYCACVIKNTPITGAVDSKSGARSVLFQIQQALDTPFTDDSGAQCRVARVYVISPQQISQPAINSIQGKLSENAGRVVFVGGHKLFALFKKHWPDFVLDESGAIAEYINRLKGAAAGKENLAALTGLYDLDSPGKADGNVYVQQSMYKDIFLPSLRDNIDSYLPPTEVVIGKHGSVQVEQMERNISALRSMLSGLCQWGRIDFEVEANIIKIANILKSTFNKAVEDVDRQRQEAEASGRHVSVEQLNRSFALDDSVDRYLVKGAWSNLVSILQGRVALLEPTQRHTAVDLLALAARKGMAENISLADHLATLDAGFVINGPPKRFEMGKDIASTYAGSIIVVGPPGQGKTTYCRWNTLRDAEAWAMGDSKYIPVYISLHTVEIRPDDTFETVFLSRAGSSALLSSRVIDQWKAGRAKLRIYLDGLDEVADPARRNDIALLAKKGCEKHSNVQVIVTARPYIHHSSLDWLLRVSLGDLDTDELKSLIKQWLQDERLIKRFSDQLRPLADIQALMKNPLLATLVLLVFRRTNSLPENKIRLYTMFLEVLCGGWDLAKGITRGSRYGRDLKMRIFGHVASENHLRQQREVSEGELARYIRNVMNNVSDETVQDIIRELLETGVLGKIGGKFHFSHLSFQEFLTARHTMSDPNNTLLFNAFINFMEGNDWWREVMYFRAGLCENPNEFAQWVMPRVEGRSYPPERLLLMESAIKLTYPEFTFSKYA